MTKDEAIAILRDVNPHNPQRKPHSRDVQKAALAVTAPAPAPKPAKKKATAKA